MRSDGMKKGLERAPHRSLFKALGLTDREIGQPMIGIANSANEIIPGHLHLHQISEEQGMDLIAAGVRQAIAQTRAVVFVLECTAGQGTNLGYTFEQLAQIIERVGSRERMGVCLDTCHTFAAGYDLRTTETYEATFAEFARLLGLDRLKFFHLNDSSKGLGSRVDRHAHIGQGVIGLAGFRLLMNDGRFSHHPMTLETPKGEEMLEDIENLAVLRSLYR